MKKWRIILFTFCFLLFISGTFLGAKNIVENIRKASLAKESALDYVQQEYPGYEFYIVSAFPDDGDYYITLKVNDYKLASVELRCKVMPYIVEESGNFRTTIWFSRSRELLERQK